MSIFKCKMCGGDLEVTGEEKVVECEYCGSKQTVPNADDEKKVKLFNRANRLRMSCEFDKAAGIYEQIVAEFPEEAETYWGLCLANYGIEYVDDPATGDKIPTCHRASFEKMRKDENYELALENADMAARIVYEEQAKEIDRIMGDILAISRDEKPYDVFICYKETDSSGSRTLDSVLAQEIYDALCAKSYRVFFSRITLEDKLGTQYEPYIFSALNSAKMMLVVGTDYEYMNAVWVKNEWSRFIKLMAKDKTKVLIPCYKDMDPYDMPDEFRAYQSQDCGKVGFMQDLTRGIDKIFGRTEQTNAEKSGQADIAPLLKRAFMFLEDGKLQDADDYCEKVLDKDPENAEAYLGKLMVELNVGKKEELKNCDMPFEDNINYQKVVRFGDETLKKDLESYNEVIEKRNEENARLETEEQRTEEESIYTQLVEALENKKIQDESQIKLCEAKQRKAELEKLLQNQLSQFEKNKNEITNTTEVLNRTQDKLQLLTSEKHCVDNDISSAEKQLASLGVFAFSQKKELTQNIERLTAESCRLAGEIDSNRQKVRTLNAELENLGSISELEQKNEEVTKNIVSKQQIADKEINLIETTLAEKQRSGTKKLTLSEISEELEKKDYILDSIKRDKKKLEVLSRFSNIPIKIVYKLGLPVFFGTYPQGANKERSPIVWKIIAVECGRALLLSECGIPNQSYNTSQTFWEEVTWETCTLRAWLNKKFLNDAFSAEEQAKIEATYVHADKNPKCTTDPGKTTRDKVFLLSINEAEKYFSSDEARMCEQAMDERTITSGKGIWWRLRSPGKGSNYAAVVHGDGSIGYDGLHVKNSVDVRPAVWIKLDISELF